MKNTFIETWKAGANAIAKAYEMYGQDYKEKLKNLAEEQRKLIEDSRPNKDLPAYQQMNEDQKEFMKYLFKVIETGELEQ